MTSVLMLVSFMAMLLGCTIGCIQVFSEQQHDYGSSIPAIPEMCHPQQKIASPLSTSKTDLNGIT
jgi:hypothetical protein